MFVGLTAWLSLHVLIIDPLIHIHSLVNELTNVVLGKSNSLVNPFMLARMVHF